MNDDFMDVLNVLSFVIGLLNYGENVTLRDMQNLESDFTQKADFLLREIHNHLEKQDEKIDAILKRLEDRK